MFQSKLLRAVLVAVGLLLTTMKDMDVAPRIPLLVQALCLIAGGVMAAGTTVHYIRARQR